MAITRAQQAKQMLQNGGMLVQPGFGGARQGYRSEKAQEAQGRTGGSKSGDKGQGRDRDFQQRGMSKADYDKAVKSGDVGQNFSARPGFTKNLKNKIETASLKNIIDQKRGLKNPFSLGFTKALDLMNPALNVYEDDDEDSLMDTEYGMKGKDLTDISRAIDALDKSKTVGLTRGEYLDAFFGPNNPQDPRNKEPDRGGINQIIPVDTTFAKAPVEEEEDYYGGRNPFDINRVAYRLLADGGAVMDDEPRQAYGLGSIVKKATRAVKKVVKSDIGKAALTAAAIYYGGGGGNPFTAAGRDKFAFANFLSTTKNPLISTDGKFSALKAIGIPTLASYLMTPKQEEEEEEDFRGEGLDIPLYRRNPQGFLAPRFMAEGGSTEEKEPVAKKVMPLIDMDGKEKDYRETGGFVDMGRMEKADDVPARLSKNEFVFTADAVRNAGDGSVDKGAEVMYNMMKNLEAGGEVSEESQGLEGARKMFQTSQRLEEVL